MKPSNKTPSRRSLLIKNNKALLLTNEIKADRNTCMANRSWIALMPPGIRHFIQKHCW